MPIDNTTDKKKKNEEEEATQGAWFTTKWPLFFGFMCFYETPGHDSLLNEIFVNRAEKEISEEEFNIMHSSFHAGCRIGYAFKDIVEPAIENFTEVAKEIAEDEIRLYHKLQDIDNTNRLLNTMKNRRDNK